MSAKQTMFFGSCLESGALQSRGLTVRGLVGCLVLVLSLTAQADSVMGQVDYAYRQYLGFGVDGEVASLHVHVGDKVNKGALLMQLEQAAFKADMEAAQAIMVWKKALLDEMMREWERNNVLYDEGSLSQVELDLSHIEQLRAESEYRRSVADHTAQEIRLQRSQIIAPVSGTVLTVNRRPGDRINQLNVAAPAIILGSQETVVRVQLALGSMAPELGQRVSLVDGERVLSGQVQSVSPAWNDGWGHVTIKVKEPLPPVGSGLEVRF